MIQSVKIYQGKNKWVQCERLFYWTTRCMYSFIIGVSFLKSFAKFRRENKSRSSFYICNKGSCPRGRVQFSPKFIFLSRKKGKKGEREKELKRKKKRRARTVGKGSFAFKNFSKILNLIYQRFSFDVLSNYFFDEWSTINCIQSSRH